VNVTLAADVSSLTLPSDWDGPLDVVLPLGGTVFVVGIGGILGICGLLVLSNM